MFIVSAHLAFVVASALLPVRELRKSIFSSTLQSYKNANWRGPCAWHLSYFNRMPSREEAVEDGRVLNNIFYMSH